MVLKTREIQGNEQSGAEEAQIRAAAAVAGATAFVLKKFQRSRERIEPIEVAPELHGDLYKDFREAFISNGVPEDIASEAAADIVQNKDAESSEAITEANRIVSNGLEHHPVSESQTEEQTQVTDDLLREEEGKAAYQTQEVQSHKSIQLKGNSVKADLAPVDSERLVEPVGSEVAQPRAEKLSQNVEFKKPPSEMSWPELQKKAAAISAETNEKPASRKKADVEPFVTDYWQAQQAENTNAKKPAVEKSSEPSQAGAAKGPSVKPAATGVDKPVTQEATKSIAAKPVVRTPIKSPKPELAKDYSAGLAAAGADSEIAAKAGKALVEGKGADSNAEIAKANVQVSKAPERSKLQQMYHDVLSKQKIKPELIELASKDLAAGKGAHSSQNIRKAHDQILNRELSKSKLTQPQRRWSQHSRHVTETNLKKRDQLIAVKATKAGASSKDVAAMIRSNSPVASTIGRQSTTAGVQYASKVASAAKVTVKASTSAVKKISKGAEI